ncbi:hypothetical protein ABZ719_34460 [Streptomyces sp. NPDC006743]|uniref:hypothetical protein n=1 Tax=Streptomyces sp. NPDC006743 TaxID=3154480 RepID=UPI003454BDFB
MGLDLTVFAADWERLRAFPAEHRTGALEDAVWPPDVPFEEEAARYGLPGGWLWPPDTERPWCAEYRFFGTTGSYRPHSRAGDGWADMRVLADASLRGAMDTFLDGLIWDAAPAADAVTADAGGLFPATAGPGPARRSRVLLVCPPAAAPGKALAWERVEPRLEELRGPFTAECTGWAGRPDTFEEFTGLLREWAEVVRETARRGWGLVGLS